MANTNVNETKEYFNSMAHIEPLDAATNMELVKLAQEGDTNARETLITGNMRLVAMVAKKYQGCGIPYVDLLQEGSIGIMTAIDKFDFTVGTTFSTYAVVWIRQAITRALANKSRMMRVPANVFESINKVRMVSRSMTTKLGHEPSVEELAEALKTTTKKVERILELMTEVGSLDTPIGDEEKNNVGDFVEDTVNPTPFDEAAKSETKDVINTVLKTLNERERDIITKRFGLNGNHPKTLEAIAKEYGLSRERIRQIEATAMKKLRNPIRAKKLEGLLD